MGSRIGGMSGTSTAQSQGINNWQQRQQGLSALNSALQSGNLDAAQKAYATLTGNNKNVSPDSPMGKIGAALQSGDIASAQQAAQSLQSNRSGHHHAHGATDARPPAPATATGSTGSTGNIINTVA